MKTLSTHQGRGGEMRNRYKNLFNGSPEYYENDAKPVLCYRGVIVYKLFDKAYDFVYHGACITQRAGATGSKEVIDEILDGKCLLTCDKVKEHIASGLAYPTYAECAQLYTAEGLALAWHGKGIALP